MIEDNSLFNSLNQGISFKPVLTSQEIISCINKTKTFLNILSKMCKRKFDAVVANYASNCSSKLEEILKKTSYSDTPISADGFVFFDEVGAGFIPNKLNLESIAYIIDNMFISLGFVEEIYNSSDINIKKEPVWEPVKLMLEKERADLEGIKSKISLTY